MSRRDTIIIAVLINAGLLVILFSTALKSNKHEEVASVVSEKQHLALSQETPSERPMAVANSTQDEVDQLLRQFSTTAPLALSEPAPVATTPVESKNDFAQDLNTFTATAPVVHEPAMKPQTPVSKTVEVVVKKGDVLEKIARTHHTTVDAIMKANHLNSTRLKIGQVLKVSEGQTQASSSTDRSEGVSTKYYTVKNGDNPWTIAVKNHMKVDELLRLNNLDAEKAKRLKPGDQLRIR